MRYTVEWSPAARHDVDLIEVIDPVMANEIEGAVRLLASHPIAHGRRVSSPFYRGLEYRFRVRDGIRVRLNFVFAGGRNGIAIQELLVGRPRPFTP